MAATGEAGVLMHDVLGVVAIGVLMMVGFVFRRQQNRLLDSGQPQKGETPVSRKIGKMQLWALYWLVIAVAVVFFFVMPRATSLEAQPKAGETQMP